MRSFGCDAVLFDMDGVLVDSTLVVVRIWTGWARRRGFDVEDILKVAHGRRSAETVRLIAPDLDAEAEARELEREEVADLDGVREAEGALKLISSLPEDGWTVVTSGARPLATRRLKHTGLPVPGRFVTSEDVENGKPAPEPYKRGAELLGVEPVACVVVEDAPLGIQAAKAAGMTVVAVATTHDPRDLSEADAVVGSLAEIQASPGGGRRFELRLTDEGSDAPAGR